MYTGNTHVLFLFFIMHRKSRDIVIAKPLTMYKNNSIRYFLNVHKFALFQSMHCTEISIG